MKKSKKMKKTQPVGRKLKKQTPLIAESTKELTAEGTEELTARILKAAEDRLGILDGHMKKKI